MLLYLIVPVHVCHDFYITLRNKLFLLIVIDTSENNNYGSIKYKNVFIY